MKKGEGMKIAGAIGRRRTYSLRMQLALLRHHCNETTLSEGSAIYNVYVRKVHIAKIRPATIIAHCR